VWGHHHATPRNHILQPAQPHRKDDLLKLEDNPIEQAENGKQKILTRRLMHVQYLLPGLSRLQEINLGAFFLHLQ